MIMGDINTKFEMLHISKALAWKVFTSVLVTSIFSINSERPCCSSLFSALYSHHLLLTGKEWTKERVEQFVIPVSMAVTH